MIIREIPYGLALYGAGKRLRDDVLRRPLGMVLSDKDTEGEEQQTHIAAVTSDDRVLGVVLMRPLSPTHIKFRQMAVATSEQGKGTGSKLVQFAEDLARGKGFLSVELNARKYAQGFYEKLDYRATGNEFVEIGLPHIRMAKAL